MTEDQTRIKHMLASIERIESYISGISESDFLNDFMIQDAVMRNLEIIGEASKKISANQKKLAKGIPWKEVSGMRDKLIHDYFGVDLDFVWSVLVNDLKSLKIELQKILL